MNCYMIVYDYVYTAKIERGTGTQSLLTRAARKLPISDKHQAAIQKLLDISQDKTAFPFSDKNASVLQDWLKDKGYSYNGNGYRWLMRKSYNNGKECEDRKKFSAFIGERLINEEAGMYITIYIQLCAYCVLIGY